MPAPAQQTRTAEATRTVVLLLPEALGDLDAAALRSALNALPATARTLACVARPPTASFATILGELAGDAQILLGPDIEAPATRAFVLRAPPSTLPEQQIEFAIALSDVVLIAPRSPQAAVIRHLSELKKPTISLGEPVPAVPPLGKATHRLDPEVPGWHAWGRWWFGRPEQTIMECLAFAWRGWNRAGLAESGKKLLQCASKWRPKAYFPKGWKELAPDRGALDATSPIVSRFEAMDRSALHGSYIHRDLIWVTHLGAAFAVLCAVTGQLFEGRWGWGVAEFAALVAVGALVVWAQWIKLQERWTACRLGAEQLRIARMSLPLLVLPPALATADTPVTASHSPAGEIEIEHAALADVKRAVREQGLPKLDPSLTPSRAADWLRLIVADQIEYHYRNHHKLERAETRLGRASWAFFVASLAAVLAHFFYDTHLILLATAAGPAFAAALHGAGTRLGIVHRAALSHDMELQLKEIDHNLEKIITASAVTVDAWAEVRRLAYKAAEAMGVENTSWLSLVRRYKDEMP